MPHRPIRPPLPRLALFLLTLAPPLLAVRGDVFREGDVLDHGVFWTSRDIHFDTLDSKTEGPALPITAIDPVALAILISKGVEVQALCQLRGLPKGDIALRAGTGDDAYRSRNLATDFYWMRVDSASLTRAGRGFAVRLRFGKEGWSSYGDHQDVVGAGKAIEGAEAGFGVHLRDGHTVSVQFQREVAGLRVLGPWKAKDLERLVEAGYDRLGLGLGYPIPKFGKGP